ncbi:MAG TPA: hypothetical protein VFE50_25245 [Cyclobacteriaceae bacterium]|nr:hypothetical protein [Cyclobacteriaceae bacterium]
MAIHLPYQYTRYTFSKNYNTPVTKQEFDALRINKGEFITRYKATLRQQFRQEQGGLKRACFYIMAAYFVTGVGVPILAIAAPKVLDVIEKVEGFFTILGVLCLLGFFTLPIGWGYYKSSDSLDDFLASAKQYYDRQYTDITKFSDYESYLASVNDRIGFKMRQ